jgi:radical SAM-linked protein
MHTGSDAGWSDKMRFDLWEKAMEISGVDIDFFTTRQRSISEPLCWDHIDSMVTEDYLKDEWKKALQQSSTSDCRTGECNLCGVCERAGIEPVTFFEPRTDRFRTKEETEKKRSYRRLRISYSKRGEAKYFGHLELINIFTRAFRRADIQLKYSQGFHPMPKISFETALPVGIESIREHLAIEVDSRISPATVVKCLNHELPEGIRITDALPCSGKPDSGADKIISYTVRLKNREFPESALVRFWERDTWPVTKQNRKGRSTQIDLRAVIREIRLEAPDELMMTVNGGPGQSVRPVEAITSIFGFPEEVLRQADILKG